MVKFKRRMQGSEDSAVEMSSGRCYGCPSRYLLYLELIQQVKYRDRSTHACVQCYAQSDLGSSMLNAELQHYFADAVGCSG